MRGSGNGQGCWTLKGESSCSCLRLQTHRPLVGTLCINNCIHEPSRGLTCELLCHILTMPAHVQYGFLWLMKPLPKSLSHLNPILGFQLFHIEDLHFREAQWLANRRKNWNLSLTHRVLSMECVGIRAAHLPWNCYIGNPTLLQVVKRSSSFGFFFQGKSGDIFGDCGGGGLSMSGSAPAGFPFAVCPSTCGGVCSDAPCHTVNFPRQLCGVEQGSSLDLVPEWTQHLIQG